MASFLMNELFSKVISVKISNANTPNILNNDNYYLHIKLYFHKKNYY